MVPSCKRRRAARAARSCLAAVVLSGCASLSGLTGSRTNHARGSECILYFEPARSIPVANGSGATVTLREVAQVHGRGRWSSASRSECGGTEDSVVAGIVNAWNAQGRVLNVPLGAELRIARSEFARLAPIGPVAQQRERRLAGSILLAVGLAVAFIFLFIPRT